MIMIMMINDDPDDDGDDNEKDDHEAGGPIRNIFDMGSGDQESDCII